MMNDSKEKRNCHALSDCSGWADVIQPGNCVFTPMARVVFFTRQDLTQVTLQERIPPFNWPTY